MDVLVTTIISAIVSAATSWLRDEFVQYRRRARLEINGCDFYDDGVWREFHLIVQNRGKTTAQVCVGQLTIAPLNPFHMATTGVVNQQSIQSGSAALSDVTMYWDRADRPIEITIHPGQSERLVVGRARSRSPMEESDFTIPMQIGYEMPLAVFSGPGYEFLARVGSDNAEPVLAFGRILWSELNPTMEPSAEVTPAFRLPPSLKQKPWWKRW